MNKVHTIFGFPIYTTHTPLKIHQIGGVSPHVCDNILELHLMINKPRAHPTVLWALNWTDQKLAVDALFMSSRLTLHRLLYCHIKIRTHDNLSQSRHCKANQFRNKCKTIKIFTSVWIFIFIFH